MDGLFAGAEIASFPPMISGFAFAQGWEGSRTVAFPTCPVGRERDRDRVEEERERETDTRGLTCPLHVGERETDSTQNSRRTAGVVLLTFRC